MQTRIAACFAVLFCLLFALSASAEDADKKSAPPPSMQEAHVGALGHIEPLHGVYQLQVPTGLFPARVTKLLVEEGDKVKRGDVVAFIDNMQTLPSDVAETKDVAASRRADYEQAQRDYHRFKALVAQGVVSEETFEQSKKKMQMAEEQMHAAHAAVTSRATQLGRTAIVAPIDGTVLEIFARDGESAPWNKGVLSVGMTDHMMAVAEVYETDIHRVRIGQRAVVRSNALSGPQEGTVERIGLQVRPPRDFSPNPVENTESRVIKVHIRLDDPKAVEHLTGLRVDVVIKTH